MFALKSILMLIFPFYRVEFPVEMYPAEWTYTEYWQGVPEKTIPVEASEVSALKDFLTAHRSGWRYDLTTVAPQHFFSSSAMTINCANGSVVVNFGGEQGAQISRSMDTPCPLPNVAVPVDAD